MSLIRFIEKLQNKPRHIRLQILWASVLTAMFFIVSGWVISLKYSLSLTDEKKEIQETETANSPSLMDLFKANVGSFFEKKNEEKSDAVDENNNPENETNSGQKNINLDSDQNDAKPTVLPLSQ